MRNRIILFGATGTLGLYVVDRLCAVLNRTEWEVILVGRRKEMRFFDRYFPLMRYKAMDITDWDSFYELPWENVYAVIDLAGSSPMHMAGYDPREYITQNMMGALNIAEYARMTDCDRIIYAQDACDLDGYRGSREPLPDDAPVRPPLKGDHAVYATTKIAAAQVFRAYEAEYGILSFILRTPTVLCYMPDSKHLYDGGKPSIRSYSYLIRRAKAGAALDLWGDPDSKLDVLYVKDFCQMVELALLAERHVGGTFNVGSGTAVTFGDLAGHIAREFSPLGHLSEVALRPDCREDLDFVLDISRAREELGYEPRYDVRSALEDYKLEMRLNRFADFFHEKLAR
ncbi:MAG: NAD-dependent epimerase/dehydratase family protein [Coriobacteriales bacterium]|jgi:UDP-glucose 4-epimerase